MLFASSANIVTVGKFLLKVGGRPGIPIRVELTESERAVHDTNRRWRGVMGR